MLLRVLAASLCLALPVAISATPVTLSIYGDDEAAAIDLGTSSGVGGSCSTTGDRSSCDGGYGAGISGSLSADLEGDLLSNLSGDIHIDGIGTISVSDGVLDFSGNLDSYFTTNHGTFYFGSYDWSGGDFWVLGGNWDSYCNSWLGCKSFWLRLHGSVEPSTQIPEPSAALLFGLGAVAVSRRVSRRR